MSFQALKTVLNLLFNVVSKSFVSSIVCYVMNNFNKNYCKLVFVLELSFIKDITFCLLHFTKGANI